MRDDKTEKSVGGNEFFALLFSDDIFCRGLGKVMLSASMLETSLRKYLNVRGIEQKNRKSTLGALVNTLKKHQLLSGNGEMHFDDLTLKRNYLAHNLYELFTDQISESLLPRHNLVEYDIELFSERAHGLAEDLLHFVKQVEKKCRCEESEGLLL